MSSHFYGYYGYYFKCTLKSGLIDGMGLICMDHPEASINPHELFCSYCGEPLTQRKKEDALLTFLGMTQDEDGDITKTEIKALERIVTYFGNDNEEYNIESLIPQSSKVFGLYVTDDEGDSEMKPPKIDGIMATRKLLKKEFTILRKHYKKVELKFGFLSDYC